MQHPQLCRARQDLGVLGQAVIGELQLVGEARAARGADAQAQPNALAAFLDVALDVLRSVNRDSFTGSAGSTPTVNSCSRPSTAC